MSEKLTTKKAKSIIEEGFSKKSIKKFTEFLKEKSMENQYYDAVAYTYNQRAYPEDALESDVTCAFEDESELGSCFIKFDSSLEGRKFWENFNNDWQNYRK